MNIYKSFSFFVLLPKTRENPNWQGRGFSFFVLLHGPWHLPTEGRIVLVSLCCYICKFYYRHQTQIVLVSLCCYLLWTDSCSQSQMFQFLCVVTLTISCMKTVTMCFSFFVLLQQLHGRKLITVHVLVSLCCYDTVIIYNHIAKCFSFFVLLPIPVFD